MSSFGAALHSGRTWGHAVGPWTLAAGARPCQLRAGLGAPGGSLRLFGSLSFATAPLTEPKWFLRTLEIASRERLPQWQWEIKPPAGFRNHSPSAQKPAGVKRVCLFLSNVIATRAHAKLPCIHTLSKENLSSRTSSKQNLGWPRSATNNRSFSAGVSYVLRFSRFDEPATTCHQERPS